MDATIWQLVEKHFFEIVDLEAAAQQAALNNLENENPAVHKEVVALLKEENALHPLLNTGTNKTWLGWTDNHLVGTRIDAYELKSMLGSGGMGSVFLAERVDGNFDQTVALKLVQEGFLQHSNTTHFNRERQILAKLNHPNIAGLLDGGVFQDERPYYTMEYVEGLPIDTYCEEKKFGLQDRLNLYVQVLDAVQHAHQHLVLHLDLKPSNILVDKEGRVKLLDFGISRMLETVPVPLNEDVPDDLDKRYTLAHAAPEQLSHGELSTASDIYALGVILFQLVTGKHPFHEDMKSKEFLRTSILSKPAPYLSEAIPKDRLGELPFSRTFLNDLDTICLEALQKVPTERYLSVEALKNDIKALGKQEPISLLSSRWQYVAKKFLQRNRFTVALLTLFFLALVSISTIFTINLNKERKFALEEATKARRMNELLTDMFSLANPNISLGEEMTAKEMLEIGLEKLPEQLESQPGILAEMYGTIGGVYMDLAEYEKADSVLQLALEIQEDAFDRPRSWLVLTYYYLGSSKYRSSDYDTARMYLIKGLEIEKKLSETEQGLADDIYFEWGSLEGEIGNFQRSDSLLKLSLDAQDEEGSLADSMNAIIYLSMGINARKLGEYEQAKEYYENAYDLRKKIYPAKHPEIAHSLNHFASLYFDQKDYETALPYAKESYEMRQEVFGDLHPETIASLANMSRTFTQLGRYEEAIENYRTMLASIKSIYGEKHQYVGSMLSNIGKILGLQGNLEASEQHYKQALEVVNASLPKDALAKGGLYLGTAVVMFKREKYTEALPYFRESIRIRKVNLPEDHHLVALSEKGLGECLVELQEYGEAKSLLNHAKETLSSKGDTYAAELSAIERSLTKIPLP